MPWITELDVLCEDTVEDVDVKSDFPDILALYLIGTSLGMHKAQESRNFRVAKE